MALTTNLRHSARLLARSPIFTPTSVISLALGIGAAVTIFSLTDALLFEPTVGVRNADELVDIGRANEGSGFDNMSHPAYRYLRDHSQTTGVATVDFGGRPMSLTVPGSSERVIGTQVSDNYFDVPNTRPALGRFFLADEDQVPRQKPVVVLSHDMWSTRFNSAPTILERPLRLNNHDFTVGGVAEPGLEGSSMVGTGLWVPFAMLQIARGEPANRLTQPGAPGTSRWAGSSQVCRSGRSASPQSIRCHVVEPRCCSSWCWPWRPGPRPAVRRLPIRQRR